MKKVDKELLNTISKMDIVGVRAALFKGANPNVSNHIGVTPLMIATRLNDIDSIRELLKQGADIDKVDYIGRTAFQYALKYRSNQALQVLLITEEC